MLDQLLVPGFSGSLSKESISSFNVLLVGIYCLIMKARISGHCCALRNVTKPAISGTSGFLKDSLTGSKCKLLFFLITEVKDFFDARLNNELCTLVTGM